MKEVRRNPNLITSFNGFREEKSNADIWLQKARQLLLDSSDFYKIF